MEVNNITKRLERLYATIGQARDGEIEQYFKMEKVDAPKNSFECLVTFNNGQTDAETTSAAIAIILHIANLKDHLKNIAGERGENPNLIEKEIDESLALKIVIDLSNAEKHGYPTKTNRSGRHPTIQNIHHSIDIPPQGEVGINFTTGELINKSGDVTIIIDADIFSDDGELLFRFPALTREAIKKWEEVIEKFDIKAKN